MMLQNKSTQTLASLTFLSILCYCVVYYVDAHIASLLGSADYGSVKIKLRFLHNLVHVAILGQDGALLQYAATYNSAHNTELLAGFNYWLIRSISVRIILLWTVCLLLFCYASYYHNNSLQVWSAWLCFAPGIMILSFIDRYFLSLKKYYLSYIPRNLLQPIILLAILYMLPYITPESVLLTYGSSYLVILLLFFPFVYYYYPIPCHKPHTLSRSWWIDSWYYWTSMIITQTSRSLNLFLLGILGTNSHEIGYYSALLTVTLGLYVFTKSLDNYLKPWITLARSDKLSFFPILVHCNRIRLGLVACLCGFVMLYAPWIMSTFGEDFVVHNNSLRLLILMYSLFTLGQPNFDILSYSGFNHITSKIMIVKLILMLLSTILLIPSLGLRGCLWADGLTSILAVITATVCCKHYLGFHGWKFLYP